MALVIHDGEHHEPEFIDQQMITNPEPCNFLDSDIEKLKLKDSFPPGTIFRSYDPEAHADFRSQKWVCFPEYPFTIGIKYPFPPLFNDFFSTTGLCYPQTMPMVWRVLSVIQTINDFYDQDLSIPELAQTYNLRSHGSHYFLFQIKPNRSPLVLRATQNDPKWKGRFFFVERNSLPDGNSIHSVWVPKAIFTDLAPPLLDTEEKLRKFLEVPEDTRTFKHPHLTESIGSQESEATMSAHFSLSDIDIETPKKEKISTEFPKLRVPNLRSKSAAKRRKTEDVIDLDDSFDYDKVTEQTSKWVHEKLELIEDMQKLAHARLAAAEKDAAEITKLRKEVKDLKASIAKKSAEAELRIMREKDTLLNEIKRDATIAVLEARIQMAMEAADKGFDVSIWKLQTWKDRLAGVKGDDPEVEVTPVGTSNKATKAPKVTADKAPKSKSTKAPKPASDNAPKAMEEMVAVVEENEDAAMANQDPVTKVMKELATVATGEETEGGDPLGEEGK